MQYELINNVVNELSLSLAGAKASKIYQPSEFLVIMKFWNGRETLRLLLSADSPQSRIHLTEEDYLNPSTPPRFCQLLRSRITTVLSVDMFNEDRIVMMQCVGKQGSCALIVELTGQKSNMLLCDQDGVIIDCLKRYQGSDSGGGCMPGKPYVAPDQQKRMSIKKETYERTPNQSWSQFVEKSYTEASETVHTHDLKGQLKKTIRKQMARLKKRIASIDSEAQKQQGFTKYKEFGELILAHIYLIARGMDRVSLENYYSQPPQSIEINLDPLLSPQQNAEKYFQRYKKFKRGLDHSARRLTESKEELEWLAQFDYQLDDSVKKSDIEEIAEELRKAGLLKEKNKLHKRRTQQPSKPVETRSPSGFKIIWGRNNRQNDEISTKLIREGDLWFHAYRIPGSHVVLKKGEKTTSFLDADIHYAAAIAAGYSKGRLDTKLEVMVAEASRVKKPNGARPGLVTVQKYKTILVAPIRVDI